MTDCTVERSASEDPLAAPGGILILIARQVLGDDDARSRCDRCNGTGKSAGHDCPGCWCGEGFRLKINDGDPPKPRLDRPSRKSPTPRRS